MNKTRTGVALAVAGALALGTVAPSLAAPVPASPGAVKAAASSPAINVRYYGHGGWHGGWFPGAILGGLALGALGAATYPYWGYGYYDAPYAYYDDGYYGTYGYGYAPYAYGYGYAPGFGYRGHYGGWHHGGHYRHH